MLSRRRLLLGLGLVVVLVVAYVAWSVWQVQRDLVRAEAAVDDLVAAVDADDQTGRDQAIVDLQEAARSAQSGTDGPLWSVLAHLPVVGDDADGVRALSGSLETVAADGVGPLAGMVTDLDGLTVDGRIDLDVVVGLQAPVEQARVAFDAAAEAVGDLDSSGYAGPLRVRFDSYVTRVTDASHALGAAQTATTALPDMVGADGPRDYLLVFQNNAEIRATGGMPGSWAHLHAEDGKLSMVKQGTAGDFPMTTTPVLPLSDEEVAVYGKELGLYFQDPGFTPDFPRAAELFAAHWDAKFPNVDLDGVLALDPVGMSYLLNGTGPVIVGETTLTADNTVAELLNTPYLELDPAAQDALFQDIARAIFEAATGELASPVEFVRGLSRAAEEGRFLVAPFNKGDLDNLGDSDVLGALPGDDGSTPHVDIGLNDATGSKMSYYLRYWADVEAASCRGGVQTLNGSMSLSQAIAPSAAAQLPVSITGGGTYGTEPGGQLVQVRIYGPFGGTIERVRLDGREVVPPKDLVIDGRPVITLTVLLDTRKTADINWAMTTGEGQTGRGQVAMTPSVVAGTKDSSFASAC